jgi:hypothetical protein
LTDVNSRIADPGDWPGRRCPPRMLPGNQINQGTDAALRRKTLLIRSSEVHRYGISFSLKRIEKQFQPEGEY